MTGDSYADFGIDDYCSYNRNFLGETNLAMNSASDCS